MDREGSQFQLYYASKRERLLGLTIFLLMLISFFLHLCGFADILFKNIDYRNNQTEIKKNNSISINNKNFDDIFDINLLPFFCIIAHLIWTIVPIVVLEQCCISNTKSIYRIILKLVICTCPSLLCCELSITLVCHMKFLRNDLLMISIKWLIFLGTIFLSFWTGILSDNNKWRGIHGGQIAPEHHSPFALLISSIELVCNYILELFVGINFPLYCNNECQLDEVYRLTVDTNPFGNLSDLSFQFSMSTRNSIEPSIKYYIQDVALYQTVKYLEKVVFIQSLAGNRYVLTTILDSNSYERSVSGLVSLDASSISVSFLSLSPSDSDLRHQDDFIKLVKNVESILFRQDATVKLIYNDEKDAVVFQAINLPDYNFLVLDNETNTTLVITKYDQQITIDKLDERFF